MSSFKLAAFDLDGTLLNKKGEITTQAAAALKGLVDMGLIVCLATGRHFRTAEGIAKDIGLNGPVLCYNGGVIRYAGADKPYYANYLEQGIIHELIDFTYENGLYLQLYDEQNRIVVDKIVPETKIDPDFYTTDTVELGDLRKVSNFTSPKMMVYNFDTAVIDKLIPYLKERWGDRLYVAQSSPNLAEMLNRGVNKRSALERLTADLGIAREEVFACGDSSNDAEMLAFAGCGCAVANGMDVTKAQADYICQNENEQGVIEAINKFILDK